MAVNVDCSIDSLAVDLVADSQQLQYLIDFEGDLVFTLRSEKPHTLLDDVSHPLDRLWPLDRSEFPQTHRVVHTLALTFGRGGSLHWRIKKLDGDQDPVVKDCRYSSRTPGDRFFDAFHIRVR